jgi:DnaJ-like protein
VRTKVSVVILRFFSPVVAIQALDELKCFIWDPLDAPLDELDEVDESDVEDGDEPPPEVEAPSAENGTGAEGARAPGEGAGVLGALGTAGTLGALGTPGGAGADGGGAAGGFGTFGGAGAGGFGSFGTGTGTGTGGTGTVIEGTVGTGGRSASASPARSPRPMQASAAARPFIPSTTDIDPIWLRPTGSARSRKVAAVKRDYYEVLGVSREADDDAIKRAFHGLARAWHPDVADASDAEVRFRELAEAYSVLSKREARLLYDRYGYRGRGNQGFDEALWEARPPSAARGENVHLGIELRSFEAVQGTRRNVSYGASVRCKPCLGRGSIGLPDLECKACGGTGRTRTVASLDVANLLQIEPCSACAGEACGRCGGEGTVGTERRIRLLVPAGVENGAQLRVSGDGNDAGAGSIPGDLLVQVKVLPPPRDPRAVRYIAFALLVLAVSTLILYISH